MKTIKIILLLLISCTITQGNAQFLKKLKNSAQKAAERTVERRVERETSKKTDKTIDSVFEKKETNDGEAPETTQPYYFNSYYVMELVQKRDTLFMTSYFGDDEDVLGSSIEMRPNEKIISVIDLKQNQIHSFMEFGDQKTKTSIGFSPNKIEDMTDSDGVSIEPLGEQKEILGYQCKGYKVEGKEYQGTVWITDETEIRYPKGFSELQIKNAKNSGIDHKWMTMIDGLALEMDMTVTSKKKLQKVHMRCVELGITELTLKSTEYKSAF
ncbi:DUF4412 domain-containing protein [Maribacter sp. CXY002]|uniref:DUF4412 domain-containing protein n=1 Tax=Maribacter luteocoastalis TaxID=3407671 RepID=UPI003B67EA67